MTRDPVTDAAGHAGRRGAEHHGAAEDHVVVVVDEDGRGASPAWSICTTCGARSWSERDRPRARRADQADALRRRWRPDRRHGRRALGRQREQAVRNSRWHCPGLGAARRPAVSGSSLRANSPTTPHRAAQLGITLVYQGVSSKADAYDRILKDERLADEEVAYMGDDIVDLAVLARVGLSTAPADAVAEVRARVHWVSERGGGRGAARELVETGPPRPGSVGRRRGLVC